MEGVDEGFVIGCTVGTRGAVLMGGWSVHK